MNDIDYHEEPGGLMAIDPDLLVPLIEQASDGMWLFWCPACECSHGLDERWTVERPFSPTVRPSVRTTSNGKVCHVEITNGWLYYADDCEHELAGQVRGMVPLGEAK